MSTYKSLASHCSFIIWKQANNVDAVRAVNDSRMNQHLNQQPYNSAKKYKSRSVSKKKTQNVAMITKFICTAITWQTFCSFAQTKNFKVKNIWGGNASPCLWLNPPMHYYVLAEQLVDTPTNANSRVNWTTHLGLQSHVHYTASQFNNTK